LELERHLIRLRRLESEGTTPSAQEQRQIEHDFSLLARPVPRWLYATTLLAGGLVMASPALLKSTSDHDQAVALLSSGLPVVMGTSALLTLALGSDFGSYEGYVAALRKVRLVPFGPAGSAGLTLSTRF
jgi:hypothetical protein